MEAWRELARRSEAGGYSTLYVTDHLGEQYGPLVAATVAAESTSSLRVGALVLNNDLRNPVVLAKEVATLALAAEGRVEIGFGAGWLPADYSAAGLALDAAATRVARLEESLAILRALWEAGACDLTGEHYDIRSARCAPSPAAPPVVVVGGGSRKVLGVAARRADIVNVTVAPATAGSDLARRGTVDHFDRCVGWVREAAGERFPSLEMQIAPVAARVVSSSKAAARAAKLLGLPGEESLGLPAVLIGTVDEVCERLVERRERWGFSHIVVAADVAESFAPVVERLSGH